MNQFTATRTTFVSSTNASQTTSPAVQPPSLSRGRGCGGGEPLPMPGARGERTEQVTDVGDGDSRRGRSFYSQQQLRELRECATSALDIRPSSMGLPERSWGAARSGARTRAAGRAERGRLKEY
jgi:hypothetical protein